MSTGANGADTIGDFQPGVDRIELAGFGFQSFADLAPYFHVSSGEVRIEFDGQDVIRILGVSQLGPADFVFS